MVERLVPDGYELKGTYFLPKNQTDENDDKTMVVN